MGTDVEPLQIRRMRERSASPRPPLALIWGRRAFAEGVGSGTAGHKIALIVKTVKFFLKNFRLHRAVRKFANVPRDGVTGEPLAESTNDFESAFGRNFERRRALRPVELMQVIGQNADVDQLLEEGGQRVGGVVNALK